MQEIVTFLWFDGQAEDAMNFYVSVFKDAKAGAIRRFGEAGPGAEGSVLMAEFEIGGRPFVALNGGPNFKPTPAISFLVPCDSQEEVDTYWDKLGDGGEPIQCGWITDKFGFTWQIVPKVLQEMLEDPDPVRANNVMKAMMEMVKIETAGLQEAYDKK